MPERINICVALQSEARTLIDHFSLKKVNARAFELYTNGKQTNQRQLQLIICGIGITRMAAAVAWLAARNEYADSQAGYIDAWLNFGIIGHADIKVGSVVRVARVEGFPLKRCHYPSLVAKCKGELVSLQTVSMGSADYPPATGIDMEAAAFFDSALWFACSERVQSIKLVSDNSIEQMQALDAGKIRDLSAAALQTVCEFISALCKLCQQPESAFVADNVPQKFKFSVSQKRQFRESVQHLRNLGVASQRIEEMVEASDNARQLLKALAALQAETPPVFHG